ncbi:arsenite methyltransferase [bacterium]
MASKKEILEMVKKKYGEIAAQSESECDCSCCGPDNKVEYSIMADEYKELDGYVADADLNLGCGLPTQYAGIKEGDTVIDLGSGAGNDVFIARRLVGDSGHVIGVDMTQEMIDKAEKNNKKLGFTNVEFRLGEIGSLPIEDNQGDVIVSNCVLNLVPDKEKAFSEIFRVLKPGAHFCISDIVLKGELPEKMRESAELYAGCIAGALQEEEYLGIIERTGFSKVEMKTRKMIQIPEEVMKAYLKDEHISVYKESNVGIFSITVVGYK